MRKLARSTLVLGAVVFAVLGTAACGGGMPPAVIVQVGGHSISKATLDHWVPIEAVIDHESIPQRPVPTGTVPDPPNYIACVAYLESIAPKVSGGGSKPTRVQLTGRCRQRYKDVRQHMLQILITYQWLIAESKALGIRVSEREVKHQFARFKNEEFGSEAVFEKFLRYTGESLGDELLIGRMDILSTKLRQKILTTRGIAGGSTFLHEFAKKWAAKTSCRRGYIVPDCKQYHGRLAPEATI